MWIPIASALSRFQFQRLSTGYSHFIDCLLQVSQGFVGINAFCHARAGMAEYHFHRRFIGTCPVKHGGQRVPALMRRVVHFHFFHGVVKESPEGFIIPAGAYRPFCLSLRQKVKDFLVDGDFADSRQCFAFLDVDVLLAKVYITGGQGNVFSRPHAGVNQDEHVFHAFHRFDRFPQLPYLPGSERPFDVHGYVPWQLQKAAEVRFHDFILHGVFVQLTQEDAAFLAGAISGIDFVESTLQVVVGEPSEWHGMEGRKMLVADFIGRTGGPTDGFEMTAAPCVVDCGEGDLPFRRHAVHADKEGEGFLPGGKVTERLLPPVNRLFDHPRPPPVSRELVHCPISIGEFHFIQIPFF